MMYSLQTCSSISSAPSSVTPTTDYKKLVEPCRTSMLELSEEKADIISTTALAKFETDTASLTSEVCFFRTKKLFLLFCYNTSFQSLILQCHMALSSNSSEKKQPMTSEEGAELLKKSLVSVIARTEAQRLAEAIANDPSLVKFIDIPITEVVFCVYFHSVFQPLYISK